MKRRDFVTGLLSTPLLGLPLAISPSDIPKLGTDIPKLGTDIPNEAVFAAKKVLDDQPIALNVGHWKADIADADDLRRRWQEYAGKEMSIRMDRIIIGDLA